MADLTSSTKDNLDPKASDNEFPEHKISITAKPTGIVVSKKLKLPSIGSGMKKISMGTGTRKSTSAPKGFGQKKVGQTKAAF
jgi:hypothetical protein